MLEAGDGEVWRVATELAAVVVSKDEDFVVRAQLTQGGPQLLWVRSGNLRRAELLRRWAEIWPDAVAALQRGETIVEAA